MDWSTPLLNFATIFSEESNSGVIVTASHNPKEYNGFKIVLNGRSLVKEDIAKLYERVTVWLVINNPEALGKGSQQSFIQDYIDTISADIAIHAGMHVVVMRVMVLRELAPMFLMSWAVK